MANERKEQKVALVTGGSTGIGAAVALQLARGGAKVLITGRNEETLRASAARHENIAYLVADIGKPADAARSVHEVKSRFGRLDVLVNNAGILELAPLAEASLEHVRRTLDINVVGLIETTRNALPLLKPSKGVIVNVTTVIADQPFANMSVYCASKAAVLALTRAWAQELGPDGVRVNAVSPGPVATPMFSTQKLGLTQAGLDQLGAGVLQLVPMKRFGEPEEVAQVIAFLASSASSYVTGAQYTVGGGIEA
jgi:NAD(P)-dependent dehydrogenase (short-subunit alcohol dehydrogenase family)